MTIDSSTIESGWGAAALNVGVENLRGWRDRYYAQPDRRRPGWRTAGPAQNLGVRNVASRIVRMLVLAAISVIALASCAPRDRPHLVLLLTVDTLRADRLLAYGGPPELAPRLNSLLADAEVFRLAYAPASYTLPSMAALHTGRYPEELGVLGNVARMGSDFATLAGVLKLHGWHTGAVVSNYVLRRGGGFAQGFDHYDATFPQLEANREMPERIAEDTTQAALAMIDQMLEDGSERLFVWVHYQDPHGPYLPPPGPRRAPEADRRDPPLSVRRGPA
jgi:hypothetical protein